MRFSSFKTLLATALIGIGVSLSACGKSSTDTVDNSEITDMNAIGSIEGTINDTSAMDAATDTNVASDVMTNAIDNRTADNATTADNAM